MASRGCMDAFVAAMDCVVAAVKDGSTPTTQPLPCLDAVDSLRKCMEADATNTNRGLVLELMMLREGQLEVQKAAAAMHLACVGTTTPLQLTCREATDSFHKCVKENVGYCRILDRISAGASDGEADAAGEGEADAGKVGVCNNCQPQG